MRVTVSCVKCRMEVNGVADDDPDEAVARLLNNLGLHLRGRRCRNRRRAMSSEATTAPSDVAQTGGGPTTHAPAREPLSGFRWPCDRRVAHKAHGSDDRPAYRDGVRIASCPGVGAYPTTMIGGGYRDA